MSEAVGQLPTKPLDLRDDAAPAERAPPDFDAAGGEDWATLSTFLLSCALAILVPSAYVAMGSSLSALWWLVGLGATYGLARATARALRSPLPLPSLAVVSYLLLAAAGLALVLLYRSLYDADFGPYADDSFYFHTTARLAEGEFGLSDADQVATLYEWCLAPWYLIVSILARPGVLDLLPLNWAFAALTVALAAQLAFELTGRPCPVWLVLAALLGNSVFATSMVHLYRDGLVMVALLISMIAAVRRRLGLAFAAAVACGFLRGANGALALLFLTIVQRDRIGWLRESRLLTAAALAALGAGGLLLDRVHSLSQYQRSFAVDSNDVSLEENVALRADYMFNEDLADTMTASVSRLGWLGYAAMPAITIFSPFRPAPLRSDLRVGIWDDDDRTFAWLDNVPIGNAPFTWLTVALWAVVGPYLIGGLWEMAARKEQLAVLAYFAVAVLAVSFVSFQPRHRLAFIVLYPTVVSLGLDAQARRPWLVPILRIGFVAALLGYIVLLQ